MPPLDLEFAKLARGRYDVDLVGLMLELAADRYPDLDRMDCLLELDRLGVACAAQPAFASPDADLADKLAAISYVLFEVEGFHGDLQDYYNPRNSYLNEVLENRCGIPISLGVLYMAVAARVGLRMFGVNAPAHFMVGCRDNDQTLYVDAFSGGEVLDYYQCLERVQRVLGQDDVVTDDHLRPAAPRDIAARMLRNLKAAYALKQDWAGALAAQSRLATLLPHSGDERRDLGLILLRAGRPHKALPLLEQSLCECGHEQQDVLRASVRSARKLMAEMN